MSSAAPRPPLAPWLTAPLAAALIVLAALAAYAGSFAGQFVFDDSASIADNPSIRQLWPPGAALAPPDGPGVGGRPLLNLSYAVNYALGGTEVGGYHAVNLLIHVLAGLALFGIVRRTLAGRGGPPATEVALAIALLWTLHPLQTASVTYLSQRAESLAGLMYLTTLYAFIRGAATTGARARAGWFAGAALACLCGMATKETMVTAPVIILLYDRTFVAGSFPEAWRRRGRVHLTLAATWLLLGGLVATSRPQLRGMGFGTGVSWWAYALTECEVVLRYLGLAFWPHPLVLDYDLPTFARLGPAAPWLAAALGLLAGTAVLVWRRPVLGFLGCWFFILLAPSSSVVPVSGQAMAENRVYLPLAAVAALATLSLWAWAGRRSWFLLVPAFAVLGGLTAQRNADYRSELGLWATTAAQRPDNPRARYQWARALMQAGRGPEAIAQFEAAVRLNPDFPEAWDGLGFALAGAGRLPEAIAAYGRAIQAKPDYPEAEFNLGNALAQAGRAPEAAAHYERALRLQPDFPAAEENLGSALLSTGDAAGAAGHYRAALRQRPGDADTHYDLALALRALGREAEAQAEFAAAARLGPGPAHP